MSEMEKGMISEEALDQVAGGLNIDREKLKKSLKIAGVVVGGVAAAGGLGTVGVMGLHQYHKHNTEKKLEKEAGKLAAERYTSSNLEGLDLATEYNVQKPKNNPPFHEI